MVTEAPRGHSGACVPEQLSDLPTRSGLASASTAQLPTAFRMLSLARGARGCQHCTRLCIPARRSEAAGGQPHTPHGADTTAGLTDTRHGARAQAGGHRCHAAAPPGALGPCRAPAMGRHRRPKLTAAGPVGLLPAAGPVEARGRRGQASGLFRDARLCPAAGRAAGERTRPGDCPPGWHKRH